MEHISDEDYKHSQKFGKPLDAKPSETVSPSTSTNVLLLADVFENFRETCLEHYNLDPAH